MEENLLNGSNGSKVVGNTILQPIIKKRASPAKKWCFTFNNYTNEDITFMEKILNGSKILSYCFQEEIGKECKTPHLQGFIIFNKKGRPDELKLSNKIHWEKMLGSIEQNIDYCTKDDETKFGDKIWSKNINIKEKIEHTLLWTSWSLWLYDYLINTKPDKRKIIWLWSKNGKLGKTSFTRYMVDNHKAQFIQGGESRDISNLVYYTDMNKTRIIIFNIPKESHNKVSYKSIEMIKDGMVMNMKSYQNGTKIFNSPHIIVFCNFEPEDNKLSKDRYIIINLGYFIDNIILDI